MLTRSARSLLSQAGQQKLIPVVENRAQLVYALDIPEAKIIFLRHCNLFEISALLKHAYQRKRALYVNVDHIDGIYPDSAGLRYLAQHFHIMGAISSNPRTLALAKGCELETIQRIFAMDSTGLEVALESVDQHSVDLLDIAPALAVPYVIPSLTTQLPLPYCLRTDFYVQTGQRGHQCWRGGGRGDKKRTFFHTLK
ncbi:MAG TPA: glycerol-3-phosphate responsive antiterminator [Ktedonobacteraceae bacterium]|jgi:glycerol uptake operon antiterminator